MLKKTRETTPAVLFPHCTSSVFGAVPHVIGWVAGCGRRLPGVSGRVEGPRPGVGWVGGGGRGRPGAAEPGAAGLHGCGGHDATQSSSREVTRAGVEGERSRPRADGRSPTYGVPRVAGEVAVGLGGVPRVVRRQWRRSLGRSAKDVHQVQHGRLQVGGWGVGGG